MQQSYLKALRLLRHLRMALFIVIPQAIPEWQLPDPVMCCRELLRALWAQGNSAIEAAYAGVYIHGLSGDRAAVRLGEKSLVAHDLIDYLGEAIKCIESGRSE